MWLSGEFDVVHNLGCVVLGRSGLGRGRGIRQGQQRRLAMTPRQLAGKIVVQRLITERIKKLRQEIAELSEKNRKSPQIFARP